MGKFFNGQVKNSRDNVVKIGMIAGGVIIILIILILIVKINSSSNKRNKDAIIELNNNIDIEVNSELPTKKDYFSKLENYNIDNITIDDKNVDLSKIGTYTVTVKTKEGKSSEIKVNVTDTIAPVLKLKQVKIKANEKYEISDFVEECIDNSKEKCTIEYYMGTFNQDGSQIDYSAFTEPGNYRVLLIATDSAGNTTDPVETTLLISNEGEIIPPKDPQVECKYGNLTVSDTLKYPVTVIVGDTKNNCALDRNLWDNEEIEKAADAIYNADYAKLKNELKSVITSQYNKAPQITVHTHNIAIYNDKLTGLVGYSVFVKVYVTDLQYGGQVDADENLKLSYYINSDKTRKYVVNEFNLK